MLTVNPNLVPLRTSIKNSQRNSDIFSTESLPISQRRAQIDRNASTVFDISALNSAAPSHKAVTNRMASDIFNTNSIGTGYTPSFGAKSSATPRRPSPPKEDDMFTNSYSYPGNEYGGYQRDEREEEAAYKRYQELQKEQLMQAHMDSEYSVQQQHEHDHTEESNYNNHSNKNLRSASSYCDIPQEPAQPPPSHPSSPYPPKSASFNLFSDTSVAAAAANPRRATSQHHHHKHTSIFNDYSATPASAAWSAYSNLPPAAAARAPSSSGSSVFPSATDPYTDTTHKGGRRHYAPTSRSSIFDHDMAPPAAEPPLRRAPTSSRDYSSYEGPGILPGHGNGHGAAGMLDDRAAYGYGVALSGGGGEEYVRSGGLSSSELNRERYGKGGRRRGAGGMEQMGSQIFF
ncbi:hypothetical protein BC830DRAFT_1158462 [Chytriomyces sp. MP71]|nr:hypothetical protein BC830DRAFT_1158462 [Chytriomyces sp. MP71]